MSVSPFISNDDGYTESAYLRGVEGVYPAVRIKYRPSTTTDQAVGMDQMKTAVQQGRHEKAEKLQAALIAKGLKAWEFLGEDGKELMEPPAITVELLLQMKPALFTRLASIVFYGSDGGDRDPVASNGDKPEPASERLEGDLKN